MYTHVKVLLEGGVVWQLVLDENQSHHRAFIRNLESVSSMNSGLATVEDNGVATTINGAKVCGFVITENWKPNPADEDEGELHGHS